MDRIAGLRGFYADLVVAKGGSRDARLIDAFAALRREDFVGPGPWRVFAGAAYGGSGYIETPSDDPAFLYQDILIALAQERGINNGEPSLHARNLAALNLQPGERVVHVGTGTGYYAALMAQLVGPEGRVETYEIEPDLAARAAANLKPWPQVSVHHRSGAEAPLPACDALYVNAGATTPLADWLDALEPGGRLLFPLTPDRGLGGMLLVRRAETGWPAHFVSTAAFIPCIGGRDGTTVAALGAAFAGGGMWGVRSLRRDDEPDHTCWCAGRGWWLSTQSI